MEKFLKKNKIVDCFFFYDEIEMLQFRLKELNPYVNYFIIIEGAVDYRNNLKEINFNIEDTLFDEYREKIIHLTYDRLEKNSLKLIYESLKYEKKLLSFDESSISRFDIIDYALFHLREKILSLDLHFDDLILVSDVDEIPDLTNLETISHHLKFDSIVLRQTNFVWSSEFFDTYPHLGTCVFNKSNLITDPKKLLSFYESKLRILHLASIVVDNGYHFSHFYDYARTVNKLNLLYEPTDKVALTKSDILESMKNLVHPCQIKKPYLHTLVEYSGPLPKNINLLNNQSIGRIWSKNFLVLINPSEETKQKELINHFHQPFFINFTDDYVKKTNPQNEYEVFAPNEIYYHQNYTPLDRFRYIYCLNEINKIISRHLLLSHDFVILSLENYVPSSDEIKKNLKKNVSYFDKEKKYTILKWGILKNNIISDIISEIL